MSDTIHATIDDALTDIAGRSFYESADVFPNDDGTYTVRDSHSFVGDCVMWTYENGLEAGTGAMDYTRLMESYENFETAGHIRYNMSAAVSAIEDEGKAVHFTYVTVDAYHDEAECNEHCGGDDCQEDMTAGWALIAYYA